MIKNILITLFLVLCFIGYDYIPQPLFLPINNIIKDSITINSVKYLSEYPLNKEKYIFTLEKNNDNYIIKGIIFDVCIDYKDAYITKNKNYYTIVLIKKDWYPIFHNTYKYCEKEITMNINLNLLESDKLFIIYGTQHLKIREFNLSNIKEMSNIITIKS